LIGLIAACKANIKGKEVLNCTVAAHEVFLGYSHSNSSMKQYITTQTNHCGCSSQNATTIWYNKAHRSFKRMFSSLCDYQTIFDTNEKCREKTVSLLMEVTISEQEEKKEQQKKEQQKNAQGKPLRTLVTVV